jgi:hypothetical protein
VICINGRRFTQIMGTGWIDSVLVSATRREMASAVAAKDDGPLGQQGAV